MLVAATHSELVNFTKGFNNIRLGTDHEYYNSSVMLMDVEKIRAVISLDDIFVTTRKYSDYLLLPDQDILNFLYGKYILEIPEEPWNYDTKKSNTYFTKSFEKHNTHWITQNIVILYYCGKRNFGMKK